MQTHDVEYPWEYDVSGIAIQCLEAWWLLHYVVQFQEWRKIALVQNSLVLDKHDIDWVDTWYVFDNSVHMYLQQMEHEWDIVVLSHET